MENVEEKATPEVKEEKSETPQEFTFPEFKGSAATFVGGGRGIFWVGIKVGDFDPDLMCHFIDSLKFPLVQEVRKAAQARNLLVRPSPLIKQ